MHDSQHVHHDDRWHGKLLTANDHGNSRAQATRVGLNTETVGALERAGDVDYFQVDVTEAGRLTVETIGTTDTFGYFGRAEGRWLALDDNTGVETNFSIVQDVAPGMHYVAVVGANGRQVTGAYTLHVSFKAAGFAPTAPDTVCEFLIGKRVEWDDPQLGSVDIDATGRFSQTVDEGRTYSSQGNYTYEKTGPNTSTVTLNYDGVDLTCTVYYVYTSLTSGRGTYSCSDGNSGGPANWRLVAIPA